MTQRILMTGNEAAAEGAVRAGCQAYYGYPITPQNEITAYMARRMPELGRTFIQSESELAAVNMVFGSAVAGARAMTSSSSPGISLKQEGISYLAACELPAVIINVQRGGPGLGNIAPAQGDYFQATRGGGHGDYRTPVLAPDCAQEMFALTAQAFELADQYRTPVLVLADGLVGQMKEPVDVECLPEPNPPAKPWALTGCDGREPNMIRSLLLDTAVLADLNTRLAAKYADIQANHMQYEDAHTDGAALVFVAYGTSARVCKEIVHIAAEAGLPPLGLIRPITLFPFPAAPLRRLAGKGVPLMAVEMSAGQMVEDVRLAVEGRTPVHFFGRTGGELPLVADIVERVREILAGSISFRTLPSEVAGS